MATLCLGPTGPTMQMKFGAPGETRTHNPLLKRQVLSSDLATDAFTMVRAERFELTLD